MRKMRGLIVSVAVMAAVAARPGVAEAQLSDTTAFLADLSNQYRVIPNVVYHVANNQENKLDLYLPANASDPVPVLMMIHGGGWVAGTKESQLLRAMPYLEQGWAVVNVTYRLVQVSRAPAGRRGLSVRAPMDCAQRRELQLQPRADRHDRELGRRTPGVDHRHGTCFGRARTRVHLRQLLRSSDDPVGRSGGHHQLVWHHRRG